VYANDDTTFITSRATPYQIKQKPRRGWTSLHIPSHYRWPTSCCQSIWLVVCQRHQPEKRVWNPIKTARLSLYFATLRFLHQCQHRRISIWILARYAVSRQHNETRRWLHGSWTLSRRFIRLDLVSGADHRLTADPQSLYANLRRCKQSSLCWLLPLGSQVRQYSHWIRLKSATLWLWICAAKHERDSPSLWYRGLHGSWDPRSDLSVYAIFGSVGRYLLPGSHPVHNGLWKAPIW
jgi:hypothetical protein